MLIRKLLTIANCVTVLGLFISGCAPTASAPAAPPTAPASPTVGVKATATTKQPVGTTDAKATSPSITPTVGAGKPKSGGILKTANKFDVPSYDIHQEASTATLWPVAPAYNGLLQYDPMDKDKIIGDLAEKWEMSSDGKILTFYLNKGVKWHDAVAFSAEDVKFSIDRMRNPPTGIRSPRQTSYRAVDSVDMPDKDTVKITLKYPSASFVPTAIAPTWFAIMPKHVIQAKGDMKRDIVGTGPFKFKSFAGDTIFDMVKNSDYFVKGLPYVDGLARYTIKEEATRFAAFRTKRIDITLPDGLTPANADAVAKEVPDARLSMIEGARWSTVYMNTSKAPWNDIRVRRALSLAIDRQKAVDVLGQGHGFVGTQQAPKSLYSLPEGDILKTPGYRQPKDADRAEAKKLLAEAGYPDGFQANVLYRTPGSDFQDEAVFVVDQLRTLGIKADIEGKESAALYDAIFKRTHSLLVFRDVFLTPDPDDLLLGYYATEAPRNYSAFTNKQLDETLDRQSKALDFAKRKEIVLEAQLQLLDLVPSAVLFWGNYRAAYWNYVKDYKQGVSSANNLRYEVVWMAK